MRLIAVIAALAWSLAAEVPDPQSHFGHPIGQDRTLLDWAKVVSYFQALQQSSDRILVREIGKSVQGRPLIAAYFATPDTLKNIGRYQQIQKSLADARKKTDADAEKLIAEGKVIVMITCSIHATEVASTHTAVEFAYRFLTENRTKFKAIYDNTIFILVPSLNPDGVDIVTQWYRKTLNTPFEGTSPPELYHAYVGHDNNRDWYIFSQPETRAVVARLHNAWHPQIVYDVHQQGQFASRMFVPPWMDPIDENVDASLAQMTNLIGMGMAADLTAAGRKGVTLNSIYDFWTPARHYQAYHGGMRILSESASVRIASPVTVTAEQIARTAPGYNPRERSWNYLEPWLGGEWRLRDIIDDQLLAWESCLWQAAVKREDLLRNFYRVLKRSAERQDPNAFVISKNQADPGASRRLLDVMAFGMVEVQKTDAAFEAEGRSYPAGSYVIRMQQPFSAFAKTLLERQSYPDLRLYPGGPPKRPYDVTAQTLPLLMGVAVDAVKDRLEVPLTMTREFTFTGDGGLTASDSDAWREVNRAWNAGKPVARDAAGNFFVNRAASGDVKPVRKPRIALYRSHIPQMDEGWTRWIFDFFGFTYTRLTNADILKGGLESRFDAIVFPDQSAASIHTGYRAGSMPEAYTGGLGERGAAALKQFAEKGGTLIFLNDSTAYATGHLGLKLKSSTEGLSNRDFYSPGSLLNVTLDEKHPLTRGLPRNIAIWSEGSPAWEASEGVHVIARYPQSSVLASGWLLGERHLTGRAALVEVPMGEGRAILFGMRPQYRAQSMLTAKLLFNALVK